MDIWVLPGLVCQLISAEVGSEQFLSAFFPGVDPVVSTALIHMTNYFKVIQQRHS